MKILLDNRVDNLLLSSNLLNYFKGLDNFLLSQVSNIIKKKLKDIEFQDNPSYSFIFLIEVRDKNFELDGAGIFNDTGVIKIDGKSYLVTELFYHNNKKDSSKSHWNGKHVQNEINSGPGWICSTSR
jgi:hypothetical protein